VLGFDSKPQKSEKTPISHGPSAGEPLLGGPENAAGFERLSVHPVGMSSPMRQFVQRGRIVFVARRKLLARRELNAVLSRMVVRLIPSVRDLRAGVFEDLFCALLALPAACIVSGSAFDMFVTSALNQRSQRLVAQTTVTMETPLAQFVQRSR
jgi:hypothetical protein